MSKQITTGMRIEAKRIGCKPHELGGGNLEDALRIDRAITAAVRKESDWWATELRSALMRRKWPKNVCDDIIDAIRKGKA